MIFPCKQLRHFQSAVKFGLVLITVYTCLKITVFLKEYPFRERHGHKQITLEKTLRTSSEQHGNHIKATLASPTAECQPVHLAWKCSGTKDTLQLFWSLKTLLYFRTTPLHFHFFTDPSTKPLLENMLTTWELPCVSVTFHDGDPGTTTGLVTISSEIQKAIYLSNNMRFLADVKDLHESLEENKSMEIPKQWEVKPQLNDLMSITNAEDLKAFAAEPNLKIFSNNELVNVKTEELFDILKMDGNVLKHEIPEECSCVQNNNITIPHSNVSLLTECSEYAHYGYAHKRTLLYLFGDKGIMYSDPTDVSVVTQLTYDRWHILECFANHWKGPMVVIVYITDYEAFKLNTLLQTSNTVKKRKNIDVHLVFKRKHLYPINQLRNIGLKQVKTAYSVFIDIDLLPNPTLYEDLKTYIKTYLLDSNNKTLVIPCFEAFEDLKPFPANKSEMLKHIKAKKVDGYKMWRKWNLGHKPTDYPKWVKTNESYIVKWRDAYEPYVVLKTEDAPTYEPALLERMGDKIAYGLELYARGYEFRVLADAYVIHMPHPRSEGTSLWASDSKYFNCGAKLFRAFKNDVFKLYPSKRY